MEEDRHQREQESFVSGVEKINLKHEDSIAPTSSLSLGRGWTARARSLVSGVGCNARGISSPIRFLLLVFLCIIMASCIIAHLKLAKYFNCLKILFLISSGIVLSLKTIFLSHPNFFSIF